MRVETAHSVMKLQKARKLTETIEKIEILVDGHEYAYDDQPEELSKTASPIVVSGRKRL